MEKFKLGDITGFTTPDPMFGTPAHDVTEFPGLQEHSDTCAIRSQEFIIKQFTGQDISENTLIREAETHGWYEPNHGTSPDDVGKLLELHGIPVNRYEHANIYNLTSELAQGHKVIISVDSEALWKQHPILHEITGVFGLNGADHAVVVSGIDTSDPNHLKVIISDPGTGDAAKSYPLDQFVKAWQGSDFSMVTTQQPAPSHLPEMAHFDYTTGHVGNFSYDDVLHHLGVSETTDLPHVFPDDSQHDSSHDHDIAPHLDHLVGSIHDHDIISHLDPSADSSHDHDLHQDHDILHHMDNSNDHFDDI